MTRVEPNEPWTGWRGAHGPLLIAEIGGNHEGDFEYAKELTRLAVGSGADVVKFQIYTAEALVNPKESPDRFEHFRRFELEPEQHRELAQMCIDGGVRYLASVWSLDQLDWVDEFLDFYKIGSGDLTAHALLQGHAARGKPIVLSSGLSTIDEIRAATEVVRGVDSRYDDPGRLAILQCTSVYPLRHADANVRAMQTIADATGAAVGYSDHTIDGIALRAAAALGARVLEFHFTDTRDGKEFRDHAVSLTAAEVADLALDLDRITQVLGDGKKQPLSSEIDSGHVTSFRRGVYFARDLPVGHVVTAGDLVLLRPEHGLVAPSADSVVGRTLSVGVSRYDRVELGFGDV